MTKTNRCFQARQPVAILLAGVILAGPGSGISAAAGKFTPSCARLDLKAYAVIEERGETSAAPATWLANAGLTYLQARLFCLSQDEENATLLYQRIIDGDLSLAAPQWTQ
jgi:hypothetical protein